MALDIAHHTVQCSWLFAYYLPPLLGPAASESGGPNLLGSSCTSHRAWHAVKVSETCQMLKGISEHIAMSLSKCKVSMPQTLSITLYDTPAPLSRASTL